MIENTLEQLLIDYRAFGLPLPPKDAPLVRYEAYGMGLANGKVKQVYGLGFMLKQRNDSGSWTVLDGTCERPMGWNQKAQEVKPEPDAVKDLVYRKGWGLAIQCHAHGWRKLAEYLLEQDRKDAQVSPRQALIQAAWYYWKDQLTRPKVDRAPMAKRLKELIGRDKEFDAERNRALLRSLELALVPSKAKPGSVEALIDDLVDYTGYTRAPGRYGPEDRYWRLAELGFEAVPALIEHLDDDRLTRAMLGGVMVVPWNVQVGEMVSILLENLAGHEIGGAGRRGQTDRLAKAEAKKWWDEARKAGEERYLLDHVLPRDIKEDEDGQVNAQQLRLIVVKYPNHIPALYRTLLDKRPELASWPLADAVNKSKLGAKEKLDLFLHAGGHKDNRHRLPAFWAIKELDQKRFDALLLATIKALPDDVAGPYWRSPEAHFGQLAIECDDPQVWPALEKVAKRAAVGFRMELLNNFADPRDKRHRSERLRLLAGFLADDGFRDTESSKKYEGPCAGFTYEKLHVRDFVAIELADLLRVEVKLDPERPPQEWAKLRNQVRQAVERELGERK